MKNIISDMTGLHEESCIMDGHNALKEMRLEPFNKNAVPKETGLNSNFIDERQKFITNHSNQSPVQARY